jgi:hypothetical protein
MDDEHVPGAAQLVYNGRQPHIHAVLPMSPEQVKEPAQLPRGNRPQAVA